MKYSKKEIFLIFLLLGIGFGQLGFIFFNQSKTVHGFYEYGTFDVPSQMYWGNITYDLTSNPLGTSRYYLKQCDYFIYVGSNTWGNTTWEHISTEQTFFFEYYLGTGGYIGDECAGVFWILPLGTYNITWSSVSSTMDYVLYAAGIFYPNEVGALLISGVLTFVLVFFALAIIFKWRWK